MSDYPKPHIEGRWSKDIEEDYRNARSDDERRQILLEVGYDPDYMSEIKRLFDEPLEFQKKKEEEKHQELRKKTKESKKKIRTIILDIFAVVGFLSSIPAAVQFILWLVRLIQSIFFAG